MHEKFRIKTKFIAFRSLSLQGTRRWGRAKYLETADFYPHSSVTHLLRVACVNYHQKGAVQLVCVGENHESHAQLLDLYRSFHQSFQCHNNYLLIDGTGILACIVLQ